MRGKAGHIKSSVIDMNGRPGAPGAGAVDINGCPDHRRGIGAVRSRSSKSWFEAEAGVIKERRPKLTVE